MAAPVATVAQLRARGEAALQGDAAAPHAGKPSAVAICGEELPWRFLAGALAGNVDSGDLELRDHTGAVSVSVDTSGAGEDAWKVVSGADVVIRVDARLTLVAEAVSAVEASGTTATIALAIRTTISSVEAVESVDNDDGDVASATLESGLKQIFLVVTHIDSVSRAMSRWGGAARPHARHIHGVAFRSPIDASAAGFMETAHCAELMVSEDCATAWHVRKHGLYRVRAVGVSSDSGRSGDFDFLAPVDGIAIRALQEVWRRQNASSGAQIDAIAMEDASCVMPVASAMERELVVLSAAREKRCEFRVYRVGKQGSFVPAKFQPARTPGVQDLNEGTCCEHQACRQAYCGVVSHCEFDLSASSLVLRSRMPIAEAVEPLPVQAVRYFTALMTVMRRRDTRKWRQVSSFLAYGVADEVPGHDAAANIHQPRLTALVGIVCRRRYYWRDNPPCGDTGAKSTPPVVGEKRPRGELPLSAAGISSDHARGLVCAVCVRDLSSLDTVDIHIDASKFGVRGSLQPGDVVEFSKLHGFIARSTYRAYLNWGFFTSARVLCVAGPGLVSEAELYGSLPTSFLNDLYSIGPIGAFDRRVRRYVVRVVYVNYVFLKRKCRSCHRTLVHDRRRGWMHSPLSNGSLQSSQLPRPCSWYQLQHTDAALDRHTYMHANMRCIIDDGSAQAELFLENEAVWELLRCSPAQRSRLADVRVSELRFFAGQTPTAGGLFSSAGVSDDALYYENQLREVVLSAVAQLRQLAVFARRFYSKTKEANSSSAPGRGGGGGGSGPTSILTFGRGVQVVTRSRAPVKLDAQRVDDVHVKSELRQLLSRLRM